MRVRFASFTLDAHTRQLTRDGVDVHLSPKAFDLLVLLVERRPAVVRKSELREHLWPGVHVVDATLTNVIAEIRAKLDLPDAPPVVRTVHRVGYAFAAETAADGERSIHSPDAARFWVLWKDRAFALAVGDNVIGRDAGCAVWIDDDSVSRRHARIRVPPEGQTATVEDLNSTNGTYLCGRPVSQPEPVNNGDRIVIGQATLVFRTRDDRDAPTKRVVATG